MIEMSLSERGSVAYLVCMSALMCLLATCLVIPRWRRWRAQRLLRSHDGSRGLHDSGAISRHQAWHEGSPHILGALSAAYFRAKDLEGARTGATPSDIEWSMRLTPNYWLTVQRRLGVLAEESECCKR